jgi:hypothetical protein
MPCSNKPPCGAGYVKYRLSSGKRCCRTSRTAHKIKASSDKLSGFSLANAKKILKKNYSMMVNGRARSPPFITNLSGVTGHGTAEKIANLRRTLSSCKKMGIPLMRSDGKKFKTYRTLVTQCGVTFTKTPKTLHASNLVAKWRARKSMVRPNSDNYMPLLDNKAPLPDLINLSEPVGSKDYEPPSLVMFGKKKHRTTSRTIRRTTRRKNICARLRKGTCNSSPMCKYVKRKGCRRVTGKKSPSHVISGDDDLGAYAEEAGIAFFGKKRKSVRRISKKIPKSILKMCKKLKIKVSVKRGNKRVPKKLSVLKKEIRRKIRMIKHHR